VTEIGNAKKTKVRRSAAEKKKRRARGIGKRGGLIFPEGKRLSTKEVRRDNKPKVSIQGEKSRTNVPGKERGREVTSVRFWRACQTSRG